MGFFAKFWAMIRGVFIRAGDDVVSSSPQAIKATYATAIDEAKKRYKEMEKAVALLARERERTETGLKELDREEAELQRKLEGALSAAEADPSNGAHREAGARYLARIKEIDEKQGALTQELEAQTAKVQEYKVKLRSFTAEIDKLKREEGEMVAEFVSHQQVIQLEDRLKGLGETAVDESIVAIRDKVANLRAQAKIATEMSGSTLKAQDVAYERLGAEREAQTRFDELLKARSAQKVAAGDKERDLG
ncbi:MAG: PspA/IM30 family protein [Deltaproteobacteria bacterium]|nr:PspA/IM30 family protein [Deltaproteobacteria bacterium]